MASQWDLVIRVCKGVALLLAELTTKPSQILRCTVSEQILKFSYSISHTSNSGVSGSGLNAWAQVSALYLTLLYFCLMDRFEVLTPAL